MSTASPIPETWKLSGDDARRTLRDTGRLRLARDAFQRLRSADGFSHARSIAFLLSLLFIEGVIALVGFASVLASGGLSDAIVRAMQTAVPGPAGRVLTDAVVQAHRAGSNSRYVALVVGLAAAVFTGTTLLGQFERGLNRLYGVERDRPSVRKYGRAFLLMLSAGLLAGLGFACVALGHAVATAFSDGIWRSAWDVARWPVGFVFIVGSVAMILRLSPRRHQPGWSWLAFGAFLAVGLWLLVTAGLNLFFHLSSTFGQTYGPLAGIVALLLWSYASSTAVLYGAAVAAQLEAVRAGVPDPRRERTLVLEEPRPDRVATVAMEG